MRRLNISRQLRLHGESLRETSSMSTGLAMTELELENQRLRELVEQLKADLKTALQAYRDVVSRM
jgi:hypothetical protein